jgi:hypothetical protein
MVGDTNKFHEVTVKKGCTVTTGHLVDVTGTMDGCFTATGIPAPGILYITGDCTVKGTFQTSSDQEDYKC